MIYDVSILMIPIVGAFILTFFYKAKAPVGIVLNFLLFAGGAVLAALRIPVLWGNPYSLVLSGWLPPFGINLYIGGIAMSLAFMIFSLAAFSSWWDLFNGATGKVGKEILRNLMVLASLGIIFASDFFNLFVFLEIASIAMASLIASNSKKEGVAGALPYLIQSQIAGLLMLGAIGLLYSASGVLNMGSMARMEGLKPTLAFFSGILLVLPLLLEMKIMPLNSWIGGAYLGAPSILGSQFSGILGTAGGFTLIRIVLGVFNSTSLFSGGIDNILMVLMVLGTLTVVISEWAAFNEQDLKKVFAFSSSGQLGMVLFAVCLPSSRAIIGGLLLLASHGLAKFVLFIIGGFFIKNRGSSRISGLKGLGRKVPFTGLLFVLASLGIIGFPFFIGFWAKVWILQSVFMKFGFAWIAIIGILLGTVLEGIYFMKIAHSLFLETEQTGTLIKGNLGVVVPASLILTALVLGGVFPDMVKNAMDFAVTELDADTFVRSVLGGVL